MAECKVEIRLLDLEETKQMLAEVESISSVNHLRLQEMIKQFDDSIAQRDKRIEMLVDQLEKKSRELNKTMANLARINSAAAGLETVMIKVRDFCNQRFGHEALWGMTRDALIKYNTARDKQI